MKERNDFYGLVASAVLCSTPIAFLTFEFMLPNVSFPNYGKNLLIIFLLSILTGIPAGLLNSKTKWAIVSIFLYTIIGYLLAFLFYMFPFAFYHAALAIPGLYYAAFLRFTVILVFPFIFGGIIGVVGGQYFRESFGREETKVLWSEKPGS